MTTQEHGAQPWPGARHGAALTADLTVGDVVDPAVRVEQTRHGLQGGWRTNLWVSAALSELETGLRRGARTSAPARAAVELVIETGWLNGMRGWHLGSMVVARKPHQRERHIDWSAVLDRVDSLPASGSEKAVLRIAAGLAGGGPVDLGTELAELHHRHRRAVRRALRQATRINGHHSGDLFDRLTEPAPPASTSESASTNGDEHS